jgi:hypothetical protein
MDEAMPDLGFRSVPAAACPPAVETADRVREEPHHSDPTFSSEESEDDATVL